MRIVYFGWDEFAVPTLMKLVNSDHEVLGVITTSSGGTSNGAPRANPVEVQAGKFAVPVYNFGATDASNILKEIQNLKAELGIVVSFGEECPGSLSRAFPVGCIEIHPSLLPKYRGPDPIRWAINNKERKTGVTVFRVTDQPYAGPVLVQRETMIRPDEAWTELYFRLARIACDALDAALKILERDPNFSGVAQDESEAPGSAM